MSPAAVALGAVSAMSAMSAMSTMSTMTTVAFVIAIGATARGRSKGVWTRRSEGVLRERIWIRASKWHQLIGLRRWHGWHGRCAVEWVVSWVRHHAGRIAARGGLMRYVRPLGTGMVLGLSTSGRVARIVVVIVQAVRVGGLRPPPPRPLTVF